MRNLLPPGDSLANSRDRRSTPSGLLHVESRPNSVIRLVPKEFFEDSVMKFRPVGGEEVRSPVLHLMWLREKTRSYSSRQAMSVIQLRGLYGPRNPAGFVRAPDWPKPGKFRKSMIGHGRACRECHAPPAEHSVHEILLNPLIDGIHVVRDPFLGNIPWIHLVAADFQDPFIDNRRVELDLAQKLRHRRVALFQGQ